MAMSTPLAVGLVLCVLLIPLQSAAEELIFRASGPQVVLEKVGFSKVRFWVVHLIFSLVFALTGEQTETSATVAVLAQLVTITVVTLLMVLWHRRANRRLAR